VDGFADGAREAARADALDQAESVEPLATGPLSSAKPSMMPRWRMKARRETPMAIPMKAIRRPPVRPRIAIRLTASSFGRLRAG
jgi:hypothetical protein